MRIPSTKMQFTIVHVCCRRLLSPITRKIRGCRNYFRAHAVFPTRIRNETYYIYDEKKILGELFSEDARLFSVSISAIV